MWAFFFHCLKIFKMKACNLLLRNFVSDITVFYLNYLLFLLSCASVNRKVFSGTCNHLVLHWAHSFRAFSFKSLRVIILVQIEICQVVTIWLIWNNFQILFQTYPIHWWKWIKCKYSCFSFLAKNVCLSVTFHKKFAFCNFSSQI